MTEQSMGMHAGFLRAIFSPYRWFLWFMICVMILLVNAVITNAIFMYFFWDHPYQQTYTLVVDEWGQVNQELAQYIIAGLDLLTLKIFKLSQLVTTGAEYVKHSKFFSPTWEIKGLEIVNSYRYTLVLAGIRLSTLVNMLPLILLIYFVAYYDGLTERKIRTLSAGRESDSIYHRAKYAHYFLIVLLVSLYPVLPIVIKPVWTMPLILCGAVLVYLQTWYYKKYW
jgi:hypothetical protein